MMVINMQSLDRAGWASCMKGNIRQQRFNKTQTNGNCARSWCTPQLCTEKKLNVNTFAHEGGGGVGGVVGGGDVGAGVGGSGGARR